MSGRHHPAHTYKLETAILRTNRQMYREGSHLLYHQNMIVSFSSDAYAEEDFDFKTLGLHVIAHKWKSHLLPYRTLDIKLKAVPAGKWDVIFPSRPANLIFLGEDLPTFCRAFLLKVKHWQDEGWPNFLSTSSLLIEQQKSIATNTGEDDCSVSYVPVNLERFLQPLRQLHSLQTVSVIGDLDNKFKADLCASICRQQPSDDDVLHDIVTAIKKGDEAWANNDFKKALSIYLAAARDNQERSYRLRPRSGVAPNDRLHFAFVGNRFALRMKLAETYLQLRLWTIAYSWSRRAAQQVESSPIDKRILTPYPDNARMRAYWLMVRATEELGDWSKALAYMKLLLRLEPKNPLWEAEMKLLEGRISKAKEGGRSFLRLKRSKNQSASVNA